MAKKKKKTKHSAPTHAITPSGPPVSSVASLITTPDPASTTPGAAFQPPKSNDILVPAASLVDKSRLTAHEEGSGSEATQSPKPNGILVPTASLVDKSGPTAHKEGSGSEATATPGGDIGGGKGKGRMTDAVANLVVPPLKVHSQRFSVDGLN